MCPKITLKLFDFALLQKMYREHAQQTLYTIREDFLGKKKKQKHGKTKKRKINKAELDKEDELVFVGIHNRRTDHLKYQKVTKKAFRFFMKVFK